MAPKRKRREGEREIVNMEKEKEEISDESAKRKRGRPRKNSPKEEGKSEESEIEEKLEEKKRGRPRKNPLKEEEKSKEEKAVEEREMEVEEKSEEGEMEASSSTCRVNIAASEREEAEKRRREQEEKEGKEEREELLVKDDLEEETVVEPHNDSEPIMDEFESETTALADDAGKPADEPHDINDEDDNAEFPRGTLVWARVGSSSPYWPSTVTPDPDSGVSSRTTASKTEFHVQFFGLPVQHAWVSQSLVFAFRGLDEFSERAARAKEELGRVKTKAKALKAYFPAGKTKVNWEMACKGRCCACDLGISLGATPIIV